MTNTLSVLHYDPVDLLFQSDLTNVSGILIKLTPEQVDRLARTMRKADAGFWDGPITDAYARFAKAVVELRQEMG